MNSSIDSQAFVICLMGPTASGKSQLAIELAQRFAVDIISVDSAMIYRGMDIGTAKPSLAQRNAYRHHLIDLCDPSESYSVGQFCQDAREVIQSVIAANRIPLLVGGSMLYFYLLQRGFSNYPQGDTAIRQHIDQQAALRGWPALHTELATIDPPTAAKIAVNDKQRIQRALELYYATGQTPSLLQQAQKWQPLPYRWIDMIVTPDNPLVGRRLLHQRIERRFYQMMEQGLLAEAKELYQRKDLHRDLPAMRLVNYRQIWPYLAGEYDYASLCHRAIVATRQLAKRQFTWLKRFKQATWLVNPTVSQLAQAVVKLGACWE